MQSENWIGTVGVETSQRFLEKINNGSLLDLRKEELITVNEEIKKRTEGEGIILFPAGYFKTSKHVKK